jgi:hypothetical protein
MQGVAFLRHVWQHQPHGYAFLVYRRDSVWVEKCVRVGQDFEVVMPKRGDFYFSPNVFSQPIRQRQYCLPSRVMYQDLDEVRPSECPLRPDLWWETSIERYQALWLLEDHIEPAGFGALNRGLNRACGADPGTWNLTRVLRVPGSWNGKRSCRVSGASSKALLAVA